MTLAFVSLFAIFTGYAILRPLRDSMVLVGGIDTHSTKLSGLIGWTFLGMLVHGFPNLLMPSGPQSGSASTNYPRGIETGVNW